ncbi:unnamed protein product, partial [Mesorhabditis belari]|uniref:Uncharacterized protein n=1 Tax=Mesorhabditis belari TaxID=2138241 RepID=A0AAF3EBS8_9BILA
MDWIGKRFLPNGKPLSKSRNKWRLCVSISGHSVTHIGLGDEQIGIDKVAFPKRFEKQLFRLFSKINSPRKFRCRVRDSFESKWTTREAELKEIFRKLVNGFKSVKAFAELSLHSTICEGQNLFEILAEKRIVFNKLDLDFQFEYLKTNPIKTRPEECCYISWKMSTDSIKSIISDQLQNPMIPVFFYCKPEDETYAEIEEIICVTFEMKSCLDEKLRREISERLTIDYGKQNFDDWSLERRVNRREEWTGHCTWMGYFMRKLSTDKCLILKLEVYTEFYKGETLGKYLLCCAIDVLSSEESTHSS